MNPTATTDIRYTPAWTPDAWATWTYRLYRPGHGDDEVLPDDVTGDVLRFWYLSLYAERTSECDVASFDPVAPRPAWTAMTIAQRRCDPVPLDFCAQHGNGTCRGTCAKYETDGKNSAPGA